MEREFIQNLKDLFSAAQWVNLAAEWEMKVTAVVAPLPQDRHLPLTASSGRDTSMESLARCSVFFFLLGSMTLSFEARAPIPILASIGEGGNSKTG